MFLPDMEETEPMLIVVCVVCRCGEETFDADAVVMAVGINGAKNIIRASPALNTRKMFTDMMNLRSIDVLAVRTAFS
jgi:hypothetical protein